MPDFDYEVVDVRDHSGSLSPVYPSVTIKSLHSGDDSKKSPGRFFKGILNANRIDRHGERFDPLGIDTSAFMRAGGPILVDHFSESTQDGFSGVVARVHSIAKAPEGLIIKKAEFDIDPLSEHWMGKVHRGFVRALSAGLIRLKSELRRSKKTDEQRVVVTESELLHGILTSQPVSREAVIAAKSADRISELESRLDFVMSSIDASSFGRLSSDLSDLSDRVADLSSWFRSPSSGLSGSEISSLAASVSRFCSDALSVAHPDLPDSAFIVESGADLLSDGSVHPSFRHLPHHFSSVRGVGGELDHSSVDKALLRNALIAVKYVRTKSEPASSFLSKALAHLRCHADAVGVPYSLED